MSRYLPGGIFRVVKFLFNAARQKNREKVLSSSFSLVRDCHHNSVSCTCCLVFKGRPGDVFSSVQDSLSLLFFERDFHRFACVLAENWSYDAGSYMIRPRPQEVALLRQNVRAPLRTALGVDLPSSFYSRKARASFSFSLVNFGEEYVPGESVCFVPILGQLPVLAGPSGDYFNFYYTCATCGQHMCQCPD